LDHRRQESPQSTLFRSSTRTPRGFLLSGHAHEQAHVRGFSPEDLDFVLTQGRFLRDAGDRTAYMLPESPFACIAADRRFMALQGLVVVVAPDGETIVTAYERDARFRFERRGEGC